jgi:hypothetical protein
MNVEDKNAEPTDVLPSPKLRNHRECGVAGLCAPEVQGFFELRLREIPLNYLHDDEFEELEDDLEGGGP